VTKSSQIGAVRNLQTKRK